MIKFMMTSTRVSILHAAHPPTTNPMMSRAIMVLIIVIAMAGVSCAVWIKVHVGDEINVNGNYVRGP